MFDEQLVLTRSSWSHYKGPYPLITLRIITTCSYGGCFWVGTHNNLQDIGEPRDDSNRGITTARGNITPISLHLDKKHVYVTSRGRLLEFESTYRYRG